MKNNPPKISIYSDGSCSPNPGKGSWCCIVKNQDNTEVVVTGKEDNSTNNRMEISGILYCFEHLAKYNVKHISIISDSRYLGYGLKWKYEKFNNEFPNKDLWIKIHDALNRNNYIVDFTWIKGHNGHPENEKCDLIAKSLR